MKTTILDSFVEVVSFLTGSFGTGSDNIRKERQHYVWGYLQFGPVYLFVLNPMFIELYWALSLISFFSSFVSSCFSHPRLYHYPWSLGINFDFSSIPLPFVGCSHLFHLLIVDLCFSWYFLCSTKWRVLGPFRFPTSVFNTTVPLILYSLASVDFVYSDCEICISIVSLIREKVGQLGTTDEEDMGTFFTLQIWDVFSMVLPEPSLCPCLPFTTPRREYGFSLWRSG